MTEEFMDLYMDVLEENRSNRSSAVQDNKAYLALVGYANRLLESNSVLA